MFKLILFTLLLIPSTAISQSLLYNHIQTPSKIHVINTTPTQSICMGSVLIEGWEVDGKKGVLISLFRMGGGREEAIVDEDELQALLSSIKQAQLISSSKRLSFVSRSGFSLVSQKKKPLLSVGAASVLLSMRDLARVGEAVDGILAGWHQ